jgi:hypothetical protein
MPEWCMLANFCALWADLHLCFRAGLDLKFLVKWYCSVFRCYLIFYACVQRFDATKNLKNFANFFENGAKWVILSLRVQADVAVFRCQIPVPESATAATVFLSEHCISFCFLV